MTGTPIQNMIEDLAALFRFIGYAPLGNVAAIKEHVLRKQEDRKSGLDVLRTALNILCLRRTKKAVDLRLPKRAEEVVALSFNPDEQAIYDKVYMNEWQLIARSDNPLTRLLRLRMICDHGKGLLPEPSPSNGFNQSSNIKCSICHQPIAGNLQSEGVGCPHQRLCMLCVDNAVSMIHMDECAECSLSDAITPEAINVDSATDLATSHFSPSTKIQALIQNIFHDIRQNPTDPPKQ